MTHIGSSIRPSTYSTVTAARRMLASQIVHNHQSLFPGPDMSAETHDPHLSTSHCSPLSDNTYLLAPTQSKTSIHKNMYITYLHGEYNVTPADDKQAFFFNPHNSTVVPLPAEIVPTRKPNTKGNSHISRRKIFGKINTAIQ